VEGTQNKKVSKEEMNQTLKGVLIASLVLVLFVVMITLSIMSQIEDGKYCAMVTKEYQENPDLAWDKYGYESLQQWRFYYDKDTDYKGCWGVPQP